MLTHARLEEAFRRLAGHLPDELGEVEVVLVGGSAGLLMGDLRPGRTTEDCDVVAWTPPDGWALIEAAAAATAHDLDLPDRWLDHTARIFDHRLLAGWESRRRLVFRFDGLVVFAPSRIDFIASKLLAGRDVDLDDVIDMRMTAEERETIAAAFDDWPADHFAVLTIPVARERLDAIASGDEPRAAQEIAP